MSPSHTVGLGQVLPCFGCLPPFSLVAIPHSGLGTKNLNGGVAMVKQSPSHTVGSEQRGWVKNEGETHPSPSHTVGLEQWTPCLLLTGIRSHHPTRWAWNANMSSLPFCCRIVNHHPTRWARNVQVRLPDSEGFKGHHPTRWARNGNTRGACTARMEVAIPRGGL